METAKPTTVKAYLETFPPEIREKLEQIREVIKQAAPQAEEVISYAMPTYKLKGNLVHFAAFKNHIGFYPVPTGINAFQEELSAYKGAKGSVQFPLNQPLPLDLVRRITEFWVKEQTLKPTKKKR